jgi:hypothetical protein
MVVVKFDAVAAPLGSLRHWRVGISIFVERKAATAILLLGIGLKCFF